MRQAVMVLVAATMWLGAAPADAGPGGARFAVERAITEVRAEHTLRRLAEQQAPLREGLRAAERRLDLPALRKTARRAVLDLVIGKGVGIALTSAGVVAFLAQPLWWDKVGNVGHLLGPTTLTAGYLTIGVTPWLSSLREPLRRVRTAERAARGRALRAAELTPKQRSLFEAAGWLARRR